jgi:hypothetical protein
MIFLAMSNIHVNLETLLVALLASGGFWGLLTTVVNYWIHKKSEEKAVNKEINEMKLVIADANFPAMQNGIRGILYDKIIDRCQKAIDEGYISPDDYDDLVTYSYKPYADLNGDGTAERMMNQVRELPSVPPHY